MTGSWPRLSLAENGPTSYVFTASSASESLTDLLSDDFNFELCLRKLPLSQQLKIRNAKHNRAKALSLSLFASVVLNYALFSAKISPDFDPFRALPIVLNQYGKPSLEVDNGQHIEYNSSSSNDIMAIVVQFGALTPIGIDLSHETQASISDTEFLEQFRGIFAQNELAQLMAEPDIHKRYILFNQFWTLKEAFTKFVGCGLNVDLATFHFHIGSDRPILSDARVVRKEYLNKLEVDWQKNIEVDYGNLEENFKNRISGEAVRCQTGVLRKGTSLPVLISLVSQTQMDSLEVIDMDMAQVVQSIIDD